MKNKSALLISVGVLLLVVVGGVVLVKSLYKPAAVPVQEEEKKEELPPADPSITVDLVPTAGKKSVVLKVFKIPSGTEYLDYELNYLTGEGLPKGALSDLRNPIKLNGKTEFEREITLGTCSTGGKCTYDQGVKSVNVVIIFHGSNGNSKFTKEYLLK